MLGLALDFAFVALAGVFALAAFRLVIGPSVPDRILALDTLYVDAVAISASRSGDVLGTVLEAGISFCLIVGGFFTLVGSIGLVRLPDCLMRLHAPTKATTLGVGGVLVASLLYSLDRAASWSTSYSSCCSCS